MEGSPSPPRFRAENSRQNTCDKGLTIRRHLIGEVAHHACARLIERLQFFPAERIQYVRTLSQTLQRPR